jgi:hypothetical protein
MLRLPAPGQGQVQSDLHYILLYSPVCGTAKISGSLCKLIEELCRSKEEENYFLYDYHKQASFSNKTVLYR